MAGIICGTGSYIPEYTMDNNDIARLVETSDEWIRERTGVVKRHIIRDETTVSMASEAGRRALENGGVSPEEVDLILVATISSNVVLPGTACLVQKELGAVNAVCFDVGGAACTGFVLAYNTAEAYLESGIYRTALVIGSESLSCITNWKDRGTCILFGDGAGAAVRSRGNAYNTTCSGRYLNANNAASNSNRNIGGSAQGGKARIEMTDAPPAPCLGTANQQKTMRARRKPEARGGGVAACLPGLRAGTRERNEF